MMINYCGYCGASVRGDTRYCRQCGAEVDLDVPGVLGSSDSAESAHLRPPAAVPVPDPSAAVRAASPAEDTEALEHANRRHLRLVSSADSPDEESDRVTAADTGAAQAERPARAADALAAASGLASASPGGARIGRMLIVSAVALLAIAALGYYRESLPLLVSDARERNLITPEEQSRQLIRLGEQDQDRGDFESAIAHYKEALALTPRSITARLLMARSLRALGRINEALASCAAVLREDPRHLDARWLMAEMYHMQGNWREAYHEYQRIIALDPQSAAAMVALARIEDHQERQTGRPATRNVAERRYENTPQAGPQLPPVAPPSAATAPLAVVQPGAPGADIAAPPTFWKQSPEDEAAQRRVLVEDHYDRGMRYYKIREYAAAISAFRDVLRLAPERRELYYLMGLCYVNLGQKQLAYESFVKSTTGGYAGVAAEAARKLEKELNKDMAKNKPTPQVAPPAEIGLPRRPTIHSINKQP